MTMEIELAKQNGIQYRLTPEGTTEMWCHDRDVQAFAEAVRAAACAELRRLEAANAELLAALKMNAQALSWLAFGECRGFTDTLPTAIEATGAARAAIRARKPA